MLAHQLHLTQGKSKGERKMNLSAFFFFKSRDKDTTPSLKRDVKINFYPFRPQMSKEIERCIASGRLDTLQSFCNSCIFNISLKRDEPECRTCHVTRGLEETVRQKKGIEEGASFPITSVSPHPTGKN